MLTRTFVAYGLLALVILFLAGCAALVATGRQRRARRERLMQERGRESRRAALL